MKSWLVTLTVLAITAGALAAGPSARPDGPGAPPVGAPRYVSSVPPRAASREAAVRDLTTWLAGAGARHRSVQVSARGDTRGASLVSGSRVTRGAELAAVPLAAVLSERTGLGAYPWLAELGETATNTMALFLLSVAQDETSPWHAFARAMPDLGEPGLDPVVLWSDAEIAAFQSVPVSRAVEARRRAIRDAHAKLFGEFLHLEDPVEFAPERLDLRAWTWALSVLWSRTHSVFYRELEGKLPALVPLVDMCNRAPTPAAANAASRTSEDGREFVLEATRTIEAGEEILCEYGEAADTLEALMNYGIVENPSAVTVALSGNETSAGAPRVAQTTIDVPLGISDDDGDAGDDDVDSGGLRAPFRAAERAEVLAKMRIEVANGTAMVPVRGPFEDGRLPRQLLAVARVAAMDSRDVEKAGGVGHADMLAINGGSTALDERAHGVLVAILQERVALHPPAEADRREIAAEEATHRDGDGHGDGSVGGTRAKIALHYRYGEKLLVEAALALARKGVSPVAAEI